MSKDRFYKNLADHVQRLLDDGDLAFADPVLSEICKVFHGAVFRRSSIMDGFCHFVVDVIKPSGKCCFEIGTFNGLTAIVLARYFDDVYSVDIERSNIKKYQIVKHMGIKNVHFLGAENNVRKKELADSIDFDYAYIDGNHVNDTLIDFDMVKRCGNVMFHEYWPKQPAVYDLVNSLPKEEVTIVNNFAYWKKA